MKTPALKQILPPRKHPVYSNNNLSQQRRKINNCIQKINTKFVKDYSTLIGIKAIRIIRRVLGLEVENTNPKLSWAVKNQC